MHWLSQLGEFLLEARASCICNMLAMCPCSSKLLHVQNWHVWPNRSDC